MPLKLAALALAAASSAGAAERQSLPTTVAAPAGAQILGRLPGSTSLHLAVGLSLRNRGELDQLVRDLSDPLSPRYRHFLTVEQFTECYGPSEADYAAVIDFAEGQGLTVRRTTPNRLVLDLDGRAADVERAFAIHLGLYAHPTEHRTYFAPDVEPSLEPGLPILTVSGLTDRELPRPLAGQAGPTSADGMATPQGMTRGTGPGASYLGSDMRRAYAPGVTLDGTGQTVAIFELAPYDLRDIHNYFSTIDQPLAVPVVNVLVDGIDGGFSDGGDDGEDVLDIQQVISMAPNLSGVLVYEAYGNHENDIDIWNQMATDDVAKQISSSWGYSFNRGDDQVFLELAAQGQNVFQASGDFGAYSAKVPMEYPMDDANLVVVGGTDLAVDANGGWSSETAWRNSGGGVSMHHVPLPSYQEGVASEANQGSTTLRNIPDVAAEANFDNYVCSNGGCRGGWGGTSLAAPRWAGFMALVNQQAGGTPLGFLNPALYTLAEDAGYADLFHDITEGDDFNADSPSAYAAVDGYDLVTGWGTPQGQPLIDALAPASRAPGFALVATPAFGQLTSGQSATFTITLQPSAGFSEVVNLNTTILGSAPGVTAQLGAPSIQASAAGSPSNTVDLTVVASEDVPGAAFQVAVTGTSGQLTHTAQVTIGPEDFFLRAPIRIFLNEGESSSIAIGINPVDGFQRQVVLTLDAGLDAGLSANLDVSRAGPADPSPQIALSATSDAVTGLFPLLVSADAGGLTDQVSPLLAVSAAPGTGGQGLPVDISAAFNKLHIASDGNAFRHGDLTNDGYAYSANLLGPARILAGVQFLLGPADQLDSVSCMGQTLAVPQGSYTDLWLLAAGINGAQLGQVLLLDYADRTGVPVRQDFSDWDFPGAADGGETEAVAMDYRTVGNGTLDGTYIQNLYAYRFPVNPAKVLEGLTVPNNPNLIIHALTLLGPSSIADAGAGDAGVGDGGAAISPDGGTSGGSGGCGCGQGGVNDGLWGLFALVVAARCRRRRSVS